MSKLGMLWAGIKGFINPRSSIVESVFDYALCALNKFLTTEAVSSNVQKFRSLVAKAVEYGRKFERFCPCAWLDAYKATMDALNYANESLEDGMLTFTEIDKCRSQILVAYKEWSE